MYMNHVDYFLLPSSLIFLPSLPAPPSSTPYQFISQTQDLWFGFGTHLSTRLLCVTIRITSVYATESHDSLAPQIYQ